MPKQIRIVRLLPDKNEMRSSHERRNIRAPGRRTGKRIGPNAKPPITIRVVIVPPNLLFLDRTLVENNRPALLHHKRVAREHAPRNPQSGITGSARVPAQPAPELEQADARLNRAEPPAQPPTRSAIRRTTNAAPTARLKDVGEGAHGGEPEVLPR